MNTPLSLIMVGLCCLGAAGCAGVERVSKDIAGHQQQTTAAIDTPLRIAPIPRVSTNPNLYVPVTERTLPKSGAWLRARNISVNLSSSVPLSQVIDMFATRGVNIVSEIPLENTYYAGQIGNTDAETALQIILGSLGLDFWVDDRAQMVRIKSIPSRTWYLNLGQRKSKFASGGSTAAGSGSAGGSSSSGSGASAASAATTVSVGSAPSGSGETNISASDDFWQSLSAELDRRMTVLVPAGRAARPTGTASVGTAVPKPPIGSNGIPSPNPYADGTPPSLSSPLFGGMTAATGSGAPGQAAAPAFQPGSQDLYSKKLVGTYSSNPETGAITVSAPTWVLNDLDGYFKRIQQMYNTDITFTGELVLVNKTRNDSEGLDISAFAKYANKHGAVLSNNALGGVTVSFPEGSNIPGVAAGNQQVGGALIGFKNAVDGLQIFNAWLAEVGEASVIQRPVISTTSGMPAEFSKTVTRYYNTVNQQTSAGGTGSAAVGTQNTLVPVNLGTIIRINPRFDLSNGLIRAQISLNQSLQSGSQNISQTITAGTALQTVTSAIPLVTQIAYSGETLLRNGDLIIVGGQSEENLSFDENGLPTEKGVISGVFGTKRASKSGGTFLLALRVQVTSR